MLVGGVATMSMIPSQAGSQPTMSNLIKDKISLVLIAKSLDPLFHRALSLLILPQVAYIITLDS